MPRTRPATIMGCTTGEMEPPSPTSPLRPPVEPRPVESTTMGHTFTFRQGRHSQRRWASVDYIGIFNHTDADNLFVFGLQRSPTSLRYGPERNTVFRSMGRTRCSYDVAISGVVGVSLTTGRILHASVQLLQCLRLLRAYTGMFGARLLMEMAAMVIDCRWPF